MAMKEHVEEIYDSRVDAEKHGEEYKKYIGYRYKIVEELDGRFRLILDLDQPQIG